MQKINYGLIVSDFDGTLVREDGTISEYTKQAITQYIARGGKFVISSGRMPSGILPRAKELGLKGLLSCCQGAIIIDIETGKVLQEEAIPWQTAVQIAKKMEELDLHIHIYDFWDFYCNKDDAALKMYENAVRSKAILMTEKPFSEFIADRKMKVFKFLNMVEPKDNATIFNALTEANFEACEVTRSAAYLTEVVNKNYSKGTALEFIAKHFGIPLAKTVAIGDQLNDVSMIEKAGLGIAVNNADESLKAKADEVFAYTNEEDAVGKIIEKYGYTEE